MRVEITIKDEGGNVLNSFEGDATAPYDFRTLPDRPFTQEDQQATWVLWGYTFQPRVVRKMKQR